MAAYILIFQLCRVMSYFAINAFTRSGRCRALGHESVLRDERLMMHLTKDITFIF